MHNKGMQKSEIAAKKKHKAAKTRQTIIPSEKPKLPKEVQEQLDNELISYAAGGNIEDIPRLIKKGANPNAKDILGWAVLMFAAQRGNTETCKLLIEAGADVHAKSNSGKTALMQAVRERQTETVVFLKEASVRALIGKESGSLFMASFNECVA
jgi:ankyrin repeat protein